MSIASPAEYLASVNNERDDLENYLSLAATFQN
jgi:hypothetical protein